VDDERIGRIEIAYRARDKERLRVQADKGIFSEEARTLFNLSAPLLDEDK